MSGREVFQNRKTFAEVRLNRRLDNLTGWLGHQTTHTSKLANLFDTTTSTRVSHQINRIDVSHAATVIVFHRLHHDAGNGFTSMSPFFQHLVVTLFFGNHTTFVVFAKLDNVFFCVGDDRFFFFRRDQVISRKRKTRSSTLAESQLVHIIEQANRLATAEALITIGNHGSQIATLKRVVVEVHSLGQHHVHHDPAVRGLDDLARDAFFIFASSDVTSFSDPNFDLRVQLNDVLRESMIGFVHRRKDHALTLLVGQHQRDVVTTHHRILRRTHNRTSVGRRENVVRRQHQRVSFDLCFDRKRQVNGHLIAVEVSVESFTDQRVQVNRVTFDKDRLKRLNTHPVQRRCTVEHYRVVANDLLENIPNLFVLPLQHFLGGLNRVGVTKFFELANDERLEQFQRDLLRQTTLMQFQTSTNNDDRTSRVIDALTEQVFAETTLLTFDHVSQRFQGTVARTENRSLTTVVVKQRINRLLKHTLLVADDDFRRVEIDKLSQAVVAVDDTTIKIVQVTCREVT